MKSITCYHDTYCYNGRNREVFKFFGCCNLICGNKRNLNTKEIQSSVPLSTVFI